MLRSYEAIACALVSIYTSCKQIFVGVWAIQDQAVLIPKHSKHFSNYDELNRPSATKPHSLTNRRVGPHANSTRGKTYRISISHQTDKFKR